MKKSLFILSLVVMISAGSVQAVGDSPAPISRQDSLSDLPSRVTAWYTQKWTESPLLTGVGSGLVIFVGLWCVSDSFRTKVRATWSSVKASWTGDADKGCSSCPKPCKEGQVDQQAANRRVVA